MPDSRTAFISYKSDNADFVRIVAEALKAHGASVWFAEYEILLRNYSAFQAELDLGIDSSAYALLFTTGAWAESRWCQVEYGRIAQRIPPDRILRIVLPHETASKMADASASEDRSTDLFCWNDDHVLGGRITARDELLQQKKGWMVEKASHDEDPDMFDVRVPSAEWPERRISDFSKLATCRIDTCSLESVAQILAFIHNHTEVLNGEPTFPPPTRARSLWSRWLPGVQRPEDSLPGEQQRQSFAVFGIEYELDHGGWQLTSPGGAASEGGNFQGPTFRADLAGHRCEAKLVIGEGIPSVESTADAMRSLDDRQRYVHLLKFAEHFETLGAHSGISVETKGVHLFRALGRSQSDTSMHAAFSSYLAGSLYPHWQRRYSVALVHPRTKSLFEFAFTFAFFGPQIQFMRYAFMFDRLVSSLDVKANQGEP